MQLNTRMKTTLQSEFLDNYLCLESTLTGTRDLAAKLEAVQSWIIQLPVIDQARVLLFSGNSDFKLVQDLPEQPLWTDSIETYFTPPVGFADGPTCLYPLLSEKKEILGVLLLKGDDNLLETRAQELALLGRSLRDVLEKHQLNATIESLESFVQRISSSDRELEFSYTDTLLLMENLHLPFYISSTSGSFIYANRVFLDLLGYADLAELKRGKQFFQSPREREKELELLRETGRV